MKLALLSDMSYDMLLDRLGIVFLKLQQCGPREELAVLWVVMDILGQQ